MTSTTTDNIHSISTAESTTNRIWTRIRRGLYLVALALVYGYGAGLALYIVLRTLFGDGTWWLGLINTFAVYTFVPMLVCLPLALLLRRKRALLLYGGLLLVAMMWFGPRFMPRVGAVPDGIPLRVVQFNVYPYNTEIDAVESWLRETDADIIFMQEMDVSFAAELTARLSDAYPYVVDHLGDRRILTRYPLVEVGFITLVDGDRYMTRAVINVDGREVALYNIHLLMPFGTVREIPWRQIPGAVAFALRYDDSARNQEIGRLLGILDDEPLPYIVAGDFNTSDFSATYDWLASRMGDSFREAGIGFGASWPAGGSEELADIFPPLIRLDYIWHSDAFHAAAAAPGVRLGSDHLPYTATLMLLPE